MDHLMQYTDSYKYSHFQRASHIKDALQSVSNILNNTPAISKQDYVFTGLYMLYQTNPIQFNEIIKNHKTASASLLALFRLFITNEYDWRDMQEHYTFVTKTRKQSDILKVIIINDKDFSSFEKEIPSRLLQNINHVIKTNNNHTRL